MSDVDIETAIWRWLDEVVIGENFCPFAKKPRDANSIRIITFHDTDFESLLMTIESEMAILDSDAAIETTLIVLEKGFDVFDDYLDTLHLVEQFIDMSRHRGVYQTASFHPNYVFEGTESSDVTNFTNRSPFPLLHLIRENSIFEALKAVRQPESIPNRNKAHAQKLGEDFFKSFLMAKDKQRVDR